MCKRDNILSLVLRQALTTFASKCTSCKSTGRPSNSRKVSFGKLLTSFIDHIKLNFMYITELGKQPVVHIVHVHTTLSATSVMTSREMDEGSRVFDNK